MSVAIVGSIAFDSVTTPFGSVERMLGGSAVHAALAAGLFSDSRIVAPVGADFEREHYQVLDERGVGTTDIEYHPEARTFEWRASYGYDLAMAGVQETALNVFDGWRPKLSAGARESDILFLAAMDPEMQLEARAQWDGKKWCAIDSIDYWIQTKREALVEAIGSVDIVLLTDHEVRALTDHPVVWHAAKEILSWGPQAVVVRQGMYGCALLTPEAYFILPAFPLDLIADPTGSGDAFAGGFMGLLDHVSSLVLNDSILRRAVMYGSVVASFCVEDYGARRVANLSDRQVTYRVADFRRLVHFEHVDAREHRLEAGGDPRRRRFEMPPPTAGTQLWREPDHTQGTPAYDEPTPGEGTPEWKRPHETPGTRPWERPKGRED